MLAILNEGDECSVRKRLSAILKQHFYMQLMLTRTMLGYTQSQMASQLFMDDRSYIDLDHGKSSCSALTLALFLIYCCEDATAFLGGLHKALEEGMNDAA